MLGEKQCVCRLNTTVPFVMVGKWELQASYPAHKVPGTRGPSEDAVMASGALRGSQRAQVPLSQRQQQVLGWRFQESVSKGMEIIRAVSHKHLHYSPSEMSKLLSKSRSTFSKGDLFIQA